MTKLTDQVENALNETRMLILGAQVLLGFEYEGTFQPGFDRLPPETRALKLAGLGLMLVVVGLLIAPGAFHQIVERGHDTHRVTRFTTRIAALALLPFALAIGLDVFVAGQTLLGVPAGIAAGLLATLLALGFWYGLEWVVRARGAPYHKEQPMEEPTPLATRIKQVLTEARVVLPGAQALLGFQLVAMLTDAFDKLPKSSQYVHLASLATIALSIVLLMAPAAYHRIVEGGEDTERLHTFSSAMVLGALVTLALGIAGDSYVVAAKVLQSSTLAIVFAGVALLFFYGVWFGLTASVRLRTRATDGRRRVMESARAAR